MGGQAHEAYIAKEQEKANQTENSGTVETTATTEGTGTVEETVTDPSAEANCANPENETPAANESSTDSNQG